MYSAHSRLESDNVIAADTYIILPCKYTIFCGPFGLTPLFCQLEYVMHAKYLYILAPQ